MRRVLYLVWGVLVFSGVLFVAGADAAGGGAPVAAASPGPLHRVAVPMIVTDSGAELRACNPANPADGFSPFNVKVSLVPGFSGSIVDGQLVSHCNTAVTNVTMVAVAIGKDGRVLGGETFHTYHGLLLPGGGSPFVAVLPPGVAQLGRIVVMVLSFQPQPGPLPLLQTTEGAPIVEANGTTVPYTVTNRGTAPAPTPTIAGRMVGSACTIPYVTTFIQDGSPIMPGQSVSGSVFIPGFCGGVPQIDAGSDAPIPSGVPAGLSVVASRTVYDAGGGLHLVANLCNHAPADQVFPQLRLRFSGPTPLEVTVANTGIYSGESCAPLLAEIPAAPPGLTFDRIVSSSAQTVAQVASRPQAVDLGASGWSGIGLDGEPCDETEISPEGWGMPTLVAILLEIPTDCAEEIRDLLWLLDGPLPVDALPVQIAAGSQAPTMLTFLYNASATALPSSAYHVEALGFGADGSLVAGIDDRNPPSLPPNGWGVGVAPLTADAVIAPPGSAYRIGADGFALPK